MEPNRRPRVSRVLSFLGVAALAAAALLSPAVRASDPPAAPSGATSASAPPAPLPVIKGADIPTETSKEPKNAEWKDGKKVRFHRGELEGCELVLVREWLRMTCKRALGATLVAGDPEGVKMFATGETMWQDNTFNVFTVLLTTPLRRGRSQIYTLLDLDAVDYGGAMLGEGASISILWREGQEDPVIATSVRPE
jgi:hypothetical protein